MKTNIGHTESAAGVAGLIKAVLCLKHGVVPPDLHFHTPNPDVAWDEGLFKIATALASFGRAGRASIAAVNSFGITGTLAHVILEAAASERPAMGASPRLPTTAPMILPLSARGQELLRRLAGDIAAHLRSRAFELDDLAYSAALRRTHHDLRLAAIGQGADELAEALENFAQDESDPRVHSSSSPVVSPPQIGWAFSGQGPQRAGMGMGLYEAEPVFREMLDRLDALILTETGTSIIAEIRAPDTATRLNHTEIAQPAIFCMQVATAELLTSWGLKPSMISATASARLPPP